MKIKNKATLKVCLVAFILNFILFAVKLYVGLAGNIISIYSDGVNNLFDSLSGLVTVVCFLMIAKSGQLMQKGFVSKLEQLLSMALSVIVSASGFIFVYNSLERLMYPTPTWFTMKFLWMIVGTALCKLGLYFYFRKNYRKTGSRVLGAMCLDCRLDFFVNLVTIITLIVSKLEFYSFDALCGICISVMIIVSGLKALLSSVKELINLPEKDERDTIEGLICDNGLEDKVSHITFQFDEEREAYVKISNEADEKLISQFIKQAEEKTGIKIYLLK